MKAVIEMKKTNIFYQAICVAEITFIGVVGGIVMFYALDFLNGPLRREALYLSVGIWGGYGAVAGVFGLVRLRKLSKIIEDSKRKGGDR